MNYKEALEQKIKLINHYLDKLFNSIPDSQAKIIYDAMAYSIFAGGKRLRPVLMLSAFEAVGGEGEIIYPFACAIEMIHTYSLIHDDLPAMDNDDLRRGKPTNHKVYGEGMAILAGDALLNKAYELMIKASLTCSGREALEAMDIIATCAGTEGMIGGQVIDLLSEGRQVDMETLLFIHKNKTAAMIEASLKAGGILGKGTKEEIEALGQLGYCIGMAFQIQDDILDITGSQEKLGKAINSDIKNEKATFVSIVGLEASRKYVEKLTKQGISALEVFGEKAAFLAWLSYYLMTRTY